MLWKLLKKCLSCSIQKGGILGNIIAEVFKRYKITETSKMLDRMKGLGFKQTSNLELGP